MNRQTRTAKHYKLKIPILVIKMNRARANYLF